MKDLFLHQAETQDFPLDNISPEVALWILKMQMDGEIDLLIEPLLMSGEIKSPQEAAGYWHDLYGKYGTNPTIARVDLSGESHKHSVNALKRATGKEMKWPAKLYRLFGTRGHIILPLLFSWKIPDYTQSKEVIKESSQAVSRPQQQYLPFEKDNFEDIRGEQLMFLERKDLFPGGEFFTEILPNNRVGEKLLERIDGCIQRLGKIIATSASPVEQYINAREDATELYRLLFPILGKELKPLLTAYPGPLTEWLLILAMMSWGRALIAAQKTGPLIMFKEIPVIDSKFKLGGGRVDAVELFVNGERQYASRGNGVLSQLSDQQFRSIESLRHTLKALFLRQEVELSVVDWKLTVGDALQDDGLIAVEEIATAPFRRHREQVEAYLAFDEISHLLNQGRNPAETLQNLSSRKGKLLYLLSNASPVEHPVRIHPERQEAIFRSVAYRWDLARQRALLRTLSNLFIGHAISLLSGNAYRPHNSNPEQEDSFTLEGIPTAPRQLEMLVAYTRSFVDRAQIIEERKGKKGNTVYYLHLDNLQKAISNGLVVIDEGFTLSRGGKICCVFPDHQEDTPSLHISLDRGTFKCFGKCGRWGFIDPVSVPYDLDIRIPSISKAKQAIDRTKEVVIQPEHPKIMALAQEFLQAQFKGSKGEMYIWRERRLDPDRAYDLGVGFGDPDNKALSNLLDVLLSSDVFSDISSTNSYHEKLVFAYQWLIHYGFVGFSRRVSTSWGISPLLKRRGMKIEEIKREIDKDKGGKPLYGLPYFTLVNRVTAPLELGGFTVNIYGRAIGAGRKHHKLSTRQTGVPHGAFRMDLLENEAFGNLYLTEGVIDALSLDKMGYPAIAVIGANNVLIMEEVARHYRGNRIYIALDHDRKSQTGQENTIKIRRRLERKGFKGDILDFTSLFIKENPQFLTKGGEKGEGCKDFNEWLQLQYTKTKK